MFRVNKKSMSGLMFLVSMSVAACNNVTGTGPGTSAEGDRRSREPQVYDKVCIDDLRAVQISSPTESRILHVDDFVVIAWEAEHVCGSFEALVEVSYDDGRNYELLGSKKNGRSMSWQVGGFDGARAKVRVTVTDVIGTLSEEISMANTVQGRRNDQPDRDPEQHD